MPDIKPGMLVQSKWRAADIQKHEMKIGLVIAVRQYSLASYVDDNAEVIWSGQTNPVTVKLKYIVPFEDCEDA